MSVGRGCEIQTPSATPINVPAAFSRPARGATRPRVTASSAVHCRGKTRRQLAPATSPPVRASSTRGECSTSRFSSTVLVPGRRAIDGDAAAAIWGGRRRPTAGDVDRRRGGGQHRTRHDARRCRQPYSLPWLRRSAAGATAAAATRRQSPAGYGMGTEAAVSAPRRATRPWVVRGGPNRARGWVRGRVGVLYGTVGWGGGGYNDGRGGGLGGK